MTSKESRLFLGSAPPEEECAQLGRPGYEALAKIECAAWKDQLLQQWREAHGSEPPFKLEVAEQNHDFGVYFEVVAIATNSTELEAALWLEAHADTKWHAN